MNPLLQPIRPRSLVARATSVLLGFLVRPLFDSGERPLGSVTRRIHFLLLGVVPTVSLLVLVRAASWSDPMVWLAAGTIFAAFMMPVRLPSGAEYTLAGGPTAAAFVVLPTSEAALAALMVVALTFMFYPLCRSSWHRAVQSSSFSATVFALNITAVAAFERLAGHRATESIASVLAAMVALEVSTRVYSYVLFPLYARTNFDLQIGELNRETFRYESLGLLVVTPLGILTAIAMLSDPWVILLIALPLATASVLGRQAARLDATEQALQEAARRARTDPLTGVLNRRGMLEASVQVLQRTFELRAGFATIVIDLDDFKSINDTLGHAAGDTVLVLAAKAVRGSAVDSDAIVARTGGEEFAILAVIREPGAAQRLAERIRAAIEVACVEYGTTATIGVALHDTTQSPLTASVIDPDIARQVTEDTYELADAALYVGKGNGKNQVVTHGDSDFVPEVHAVA